MHSVTSNAVAEKMSLSSLKYGVYELKTKTYYFPANATSVDISSLSFSYAIILYGAVYGSFGTRPISTDLSYLGNDKKIYLNYANSGWRSYQGWVTIGYY